MIDCLPASVAAYNSSVDRPPDRDRRPRHSFARVLERRLTLLKRPASHLSLPRSPAPRIRMSPFVNRGASRTRVFQLRYLSYIMLIMDHCLMYLDAVFKLMLVRQESHHSICLHLHCLFTYDSSVKESLGI